MKINFGYETQKKVTKNETNFVIFYSSQETNNGK